MRLSAPRIAPVDLSQIDDEQREALAVFSGIQRDVTKSEGAVLNSFRVQLDPGRGLDPALVRR